MAGAEGSAGERSPAAGLRPGAGARLLRAAGVAALLAATAAIYAPVRQHGYIELDDRRYVLENPLVRGGLTPGGIAEAFRSTWDSNWIPLTWISHMVDASLFGLEPGPAHLHNLLLHLIATALLLALFHRMTGAFWRSGIVAALFALHPLHVESVVWIAERKDVLSTALGVAALRAYAGYAARPGPRRYAGVALLHALALLAKPMMVTLPLLMGVLDFWPLRRRAALRRLVGEKLPLLALSGVSAGMTLFAHTRAGTLASTEVVPLGARLAQAVVATATYLGRTLWPRDLAVYYPHPGTPEAGAVLGALAVLVAVTGSALWQARRRPYLLAGWLWFGIGLVPVIGVVQTGFQGLADRYTYLPSVGILLALVWLAAEGLGAAARRPGARRAAAFGAALLAVAVLGLLARATRAQVALWRDSVTLFEHAVRVAGPAPVSLFALGSALAREGRLEEAAQRYREALALDPRFAEGHHNLGVLLARRGELAAAVDHYRRALEIAPRAPEVHVQLAAALARQGDAEAALRHYREALRLAPGLVQARVNLGLVLLQLGRAGEAAEELGRAVEQAPAFVPARINLGLALARLGDLEGAALAFEEAAARAPELQPAHLNLALVRARQGRVAEARRAVRRALEIAPEDAAARRLLERLGQATRPPGGAPEAPQPEAVPSPAAAPGSGRGEGEARGRPGDPP